MKAVRVIIVNYNSGEWLVRAIQSVLDHSNAVLSVVDNASSDQSISIAQSRFADAEIDWLLNQRNIGFAAANNQVLRGLKEDYVLLMNPDCELHSQTLPGLIAEFEKHQALGLASCLILNEDGSLQPTCRRRFPTPWSALVRLLQLHRIFPNRPAFANFDYGEHVDSAGKLEAVEAISGAFMLARRQAVLDVGLLDEAYFMHCEDLDWCKRFAQSGWQVGFLPSVSVLHAKGISSKTRPVGVLWTLHKGMNRFFDKFYHQQYHWSIRYLVKAGIYLSFVGRASMALLMRGR